MVILLIEYYLRLIYFRPLIVGLFVGLLIRPPVVGLFNGCFMGLFIGHLHNIFK